LLEVKRECSQLFAMPSVYAKLSDLTNLLLF
jgi:hypothetical protein